MNVCKILKELGPQFLTISKDNFIYGPQGKLLSRNLEKEWFLHCVTMARYNVFLLDNIIDIRKYIPESLQSVPFGIAMLEKSKTDWNNSMIENSINHHKIARLNVIDKRIETKERYYKLQKQRKGWWRKLFQMPGRIILSEEKKGRHSDITEIQAQFPFGLITIETIRHCKEVQKIFSQVKDNMTDLSDMQLVEHVMSLDWSCLALLCDTYTSNKSALMHLHSKLVPYKVALCVSKPEVEDNMDKDDLSRFVLYVNNILRAEGIDTILVHSAELINAYLIPFTIVVEKTSLENGILRVESRSTSIGEEIHITDLVQYISMHCSRNNCRKQLNYS